MSVYTENGYETRKEYLKDLSEQYGVPYSIVAELAAMLGPDEDFDGLVSAVEDAEEMFDDYDMGLEMVIWGANKI